MPEQTKFRTKTPTYRRRKRYSQALVTLTDSVTRRRRDYWLGEYGSAESREQYHRVIAAWEANERRLPEACPGHPSRASQGLTVTEINREYLETGKPVLPQNPGRCGQKRAATSADLLRPNAYD